jgi:copper chaperone CopZ
MKSLSLVFLLALGLGACAKSSDTSPKAETAQQTVQTATISIPTAQCESCAKTISAALKSVQGVENVNVNIDDKKVSVQYASMLPLATLENAIAKAGYNANSTKRDSASYEALEDCCKE